jgi:hypothetical protein
MWERLPAAIGFFASGILSRLEAAPTAKAEKSQ